MSCFSSKKKTITNQPTTAPVKNDNQMPVFSLLPPGQAQTTATFVGLKGTTSVLSGAQDQPSAPKSTISFSAHDYDSIPLNKQAVYVSTRKVTHLVKDSGDRPQDYANQINKANQSKLISQISMLNYDLDKGDGVSKLPVVNTFHYESVLSHCFLKNYDSELSPSVNNQTRYSAYLNQLNTSGVDISHNNSQLA